MKIVVCIKQVVDVGFNFDLDPNSCNIKENDIFYIVNPADKCATELAVRCKEKYDGEVIIIALGPNRVRSALIECLSLGGDKAIHIQDNLPSISDIVAYVLAHVIRGLAPDMILCGSQSIDESGSEVAASIAEILNLPHASSVLNIELSPDVKQAKAQCKLEKGRRQSLECSLPAVFAIEPGAVQPRYASLDGLFNAHMAEIEEVRLNEGDLGLSSSSYLRRQLVNLTLPRPRPKMTVTINTKLSAEQRMQMMMSGGVKESKSSIWEGDHKELAKRLVNILKRENIIFASNMSNKYGS